MQRGYRAEQNAFQKRLEQKHVFNVLGRQNDLGLVCMEERSEGRGRLGFPGERHLNKIEMESTELEVEGDVKAFRDTKE